MANSVKKLYRSKNDRMIWGVCGGIAEYYNQDPTIIRVLAIVLTVFTGLVPGIIAYILMAIIMPSK